MKVGDSRVVIPLRPYARQLGGVYYAAPRLQEAERNSQALPGYLQNISPFRKRLNQPIQITEPLTSENGVSK